MCSARNCCSFIKCSYNTSVNCKIKPTLQRVACRSLIELYKCVAIITSIYSTTHISLHFKIVDGRSVCYVCCAGRKNAAHNQIAIDGIVASHLHRICWRESCVTTCERHKLCQSPIIWSPSGAESTECDCSRV